MTSMPWCVTSVQRASTSATSPQLGVGQMALGKGPESSAQSPDDRTGTDVTITTITATGDTERATGLGTMHTTTTEPNTTLSRC